jgi:hypothetical protein
MLERMKKSLTEDKGLWFVVIAFAGLALWTRRDTSLSIVYATASAVYFIALFHPPIDDWFTSWAALRRKHR